MNELTYVFVHGLSGWGSYDERYQKMPYWGMRNGDLIQQLRKEGFNCYAASVSPHGSAYDRACELYAQLAGTRTDYGTFHSQKHGHERFGRDFTGIPLIPEFNENTRLVIFGHSFGGATIRMFAHIMANGLPEEQDDDCSAFLRGGKADNIFALVTLAAPHNGTTAYDMYLDESFDPSKVRTTMMERFAGKMMSRANSSNQETLPADDCAAYDMHIDNALELNRKLLLSDKTYYFSQPCDITVRTAENNYEPISSQTEILYRRTGRIMGAYSGKTQGGYIIDDSWKPNDGLVNTISATYPFSDPHKQFDEKHIEKGTWNVFETCRGDHMSLQGGMTKGKPIFPYYLKLLKMISSLQ